MPWTGTGTAIAGVSHDLTTLPKAKSHLGLGSDQPLIDGLSVIHTGDGTAATVEVTDVSLILIQTAGTGPGTGSGTGPANRIRMWKVTKFAGLDESE